MTIRSAPAPLTLEDLHQAVADGAINTVVVAITDHLGRLQGKRLAASTFIADVAPADVEGCDYLLAVDVDNAPQAGYAFSSWETGYGDLLFRPDLATLRVAPWLERTAIVQADILLPTQEPARVSPRQILRDQIDKLATLGYAAHLGTELEFLLFEESYERAWDRHYAELTPAGRYNIDYSLLATSRVEPLISAIRTGMADAGLIVESSKGECHRGQHEITFRYRDALRACDDHVIYKNGAREIAAAHDQSLTFMAKFDQDEGNSCHIHFSLTTLDGTPVSAGTGAHGFSPVLDRMLAGQLATLAELTYFFAPTINSYKRFVEGSFAPTSIGWGIDNRTCAYRVVGHGGGLHVENRVGGGDVNPYLASAALIAGAIHGLTTDIPLPDPVEGNAYLAVRTGSSSLGALPGSLAEARTLLDRSALARAAFGDDVVDHYVHTADLELAAHAATVTDWERRRGFERL